MTQSLPLSGLPVHVLAGNEVISIRFDSYVPSPNGRTADLISFVVTTSSETRRVGVLVTDRVRATKLSDADIELVSIRAALKAFLDRVDEPMVGDGNVDSFIGGALSAQSDVEVRYTIASYLLRRYDVVFDTPFTAVEVMLAVECEPSRITQQLHYLHKHEMISFGWSSSTWPVGRTTQEWLSETFSISKENYDSLRQYSPGGGPVSRGFSRPETGKEWDFFICHATEDKGDVAEPLAVALRSRGFRIWLDKWTLTIGDRLGRKIDEGLSESRFGIVILSPSFFKRDWPRIELDGLVQKEIGGHKVVLPIWHKIDRSFLVGRSPTLADRIAGNTKDGIEELAQKLVDATDISGQQLSLVDKQDLPKVPAELLIQRHDLEIRSYRHRYSLIAELKLVSPPNQGRVRLKLSWPDFVPILESAGLSIAEHVTIESQIQCRTIEVNWKEMIFPGETIQILGPQSQYRLEYEFNDDVLSRLEKEPANLKYSLYFEDHGPLSGTLPFADLNVF